MRLLLNPDDENGPYDNSVPKLVRLEDHTSNSIVSELPLSLIDATVASTKSPVMSFGKITNRRIVTRRGASKSVRRRKCGRKWLRATGVGAGSVLVFCS